MTLGGLVCIRNGFRLDYCWRESVKSLLPVCDRVLICDSDSNDGTRQWIDDWAKIEPKIVIANYPWTDPKGDTEWYPDWINFGRQHVPTDWFIHLDADELLHEQEYEEIRKQVGSVLFLHRFNFWRDAKHLIPEGKCCGTRVLRMAGTTMPIPSDYPYKHSAPTEALAKDSHINVYHYGFLRYREQFFLKAKEVQRIWMNTYDPRLEAADKAGGNWMQHEGVTGWENNLNNFTGTHPDIIKPWLKERGYDC